MRGKAHSDELRAEVMAALLAGLGISEVARKYSLPKSTVQTIRNEMQDGEFAQVRTETRARIDELLLDAVAANLIAQKRILETASEPEYIKGQAASSVAQLFETFADKAIQLLEAAGEPNEDASEGDADDGEAA